MAKKEITKRAYPFIGIAVAFMVVLIISAADAMSLVASDFTNGITMASSLVGVVFFMKMLEEL